MYWLYPLLARRQVHVKRWTKTERFDRTVIAYILLDIWIIFDGDVWNSRFVKENKVISFFVTNGFGWIKVWIGSNLTRTNTQKRKMKRNAVYTSPDGCNLIETEEQGRIHVACGWEGAVIKKVNPGIWAGAVMEKTLENAEKLTMTDGQTDVATNTESYARDLKELSVLLMVLVVHIGHCILSFALCCVELFLNWTLSLCTCAKISSRSS